MPKSKRSQKVSLTKIKKKGLENKDSFIDEIRKSVDQYENIYVFSYENMRNQFLKDIRLKWRDNSRFFFCKNRVMAIALGRTSAEEINENLHLISQRLVGSRGLFFTNASKEEVLKYFDDIQYPDYARAGNIASETFSLPEGLLEQFAHSLEPHLRKLGLPTELRKGIPALIKPHKVCEKGDILNPEQAKILRLFEKKMAKFRITMEFLWSKDGSFDDFGRADVLFSKQQKARKSKTSVKTKEEKEIDSEGEEMVTEEADVEDDASKEEMDEDDKS